MKRVATVLFFLFFSFCAIAQKTERSGWYVKDYNETRAKDYFDRRFSLDIIEGIWQSNDGFKYSIERNVEDDGSRSKDNYRVIILESSYDGWSTSEIKGFITYSSINGVYSLKYYTKDSKGNNLQSQNVILVVKSPILVSFKRMDGTGIQLIKLYPHVDDSDIGSSQGSLSSEKKWTGSSIVIGDRYLATNNHVVENAKTLVISGEKDNYLKDYSVEVIAVDKKIDLAILKVNDPEFEGFGFPLYGISPATSDVGTDVFVLGYPLLSVLGQEVKVTTGIVNSRTGYQGDPAIYQISATLQPGNSGGPLFDGAGNLIGIVVSGIKRDIAENVGYAIKLSYLRNLVESCSDRISFDYDNRISELSLAEKVKKISPFVYQVKANYSTKGLDKTVPTRSMTDNSGHDPNSSSEYLRAANQMVEDNQYDVAFDLVQKSIEASPNNENHYLRAVLAINRGKDSEMAIESAQYCLENKYKTQACYRILGNAFFKEEKWDESIEMWTKIISFNRKDINALYYRAQAFSEKGDYDSALKDLNTAIQLEGIVKYNFAPIYNSIAYVYMYKDDYIMAEDYLLKAMKTDRLNGNYIDSYGELMYKKGDYQECIRYMGSAISLGRKHNSSWLNNSYYIRGLANMKLGYEEDALEDFTNAVENNNKEAKEYLDSLSVTNNHKSAKFFVVYKEPKVRLISQDLKLKSIESTEESTILSFMLSAANEATTWISKDCYIVEKNSKQRLYLIDVSGIAIAPEESRFSKELTFSLTFPAINEYCQGLDFYEEDDNGNGFEAKGIIIKNSSVVQVAPGR